MLNWKKCLIVATTALFIIAGMSDAETISLVCMLIAGVAILVLLVISAILYEVEEEKEAVEDWIEDIRNKATDFLEGEEDD